MDDGRRKMGTSMSLAMTDENIDGFVNTAKDVIEGVLEE